MGKYLNPGSRIFEDSLRTQPYVDKTEMISHLNALVMTRDRYVCVSRPRRFGKTMAADMVSAYYDRTADGRALFEGTKLASTGPVDTPVGPLSWDAYLGSFDVVRLVMTRFFHEGMAFGDGLSRLQRLVTRELKRTYPDVDYFDEDDLAQSIDDVYEATGREFVFVIDEWDVIFREEGYGASDQRRYLNFLRDLLKDNDCVALAYMTGILPIKKYRGDSALRNRRKITPSFSAGVRDKFEGPAPLRGALVGPSGGTLPGPAYAVSRTSRWGSGDTT